jgi:hypothetical protein
MYVHLRKEFRHRKEENKEWIFSNGASGPLPQNDRSRPQEVSGFQHCALMFSSCFRLGPLLVATDLPGTKRHANKSPFMKQRGYL